MTFPHRQVAWSGSLAVLLGCAVAASSDTPPDKGLEGGKLWVFVDTYTCGKSKGIYRCEMDTETGKLSAPVLAAETASPSFLAIHPSRRSLYAVGETGDFGGQKSGAVNAFALDAKTGELKLLNRHASDGAGPCHLVVDRRGKNVLVANSGRGNAAV